MTQPYKTKTPLGKKKNLAQQPKKKSKMLPRVAPKNGKYKVGKFSNGVGVGP